MASDWIHQYIAAQKNCCHWDSARPQTLSSESEPPTKIKQSSQHPPMKLAAILLPIVLAATTSSVQALPGISANCNRNMFMTRLSIGDATELGCANLNLQWGLPRSSVKMKKNSFQCGGNALAASIRCNDDKCQQPRLGCREAFVLQANSMLCADACFQRTVLILLHRRHLALIEKKPIFFETIAKNGCLVKKMTAGQAKCPSGRYVRGVTTSPKGLAGVICCAQTSA